MAVRRSAQRDHSHEPFAGYLPKGGCRDLLGDKNRVLWPVATGFSVVLKIGQDPGPEVPHIDGSLSEVAVLHSFEMANMLDHHLTQGALSPLS